MMQSQLRRPIQRTADREREIDYSVGTCVRFGSGLCLVHSAWYKIKHDLPCEDRPSWYSPTGNHAAA